MFQAPAIAIDVRGEISSATATVAEMRMRDAWPESRVSVAIDSRGGSVEAALRIGRTLRAHPGPTIGRVERTCHSAALIVLAGCWRRVGTELALFAHHASGTTIADRLTAARLQTEAVGLRRADDQARGFIAAGTGISVDEIAAIEDAELVLGAHEALSLGLLNRVENRADLLPAAMRNWAARDRQHRRLTAPAVAPELGGRVAAHLLNRARIFRDG